MIKLKKLIKHLEKIRGRHTELISLYIPTGYNLVEIQNMLRSEYALTQNVKSRQTRNNVLDALERTMNHLKLFKKTPENGLVVFCGNVSGKEGQSDVKIWSIEPPQPLGQKVYWCDQTFILDPIKDMLREKEVYGLILVDTGGADIGFLKGKKILLKKHMDSMVPGKTAAGGWCVSEDSLVQRNDGEIIKVKELTENDSISTYDFQNMKRIEAKIEKIMKRSADEIYKITTTSPTIVIKLTKEHKVFVLGQDGFEEKYVSDLKIGDRLLSLKNSCIEGTEFIFPHRQNINFPKKLNQEFCELLGYIMGDGGIDKTRLSLYNSDKTVLKHYKRLFKSLFNKDSEIKFRESKNYYQIRVNDMNLTRIIKESFGDILLYSTERKIPKIIHTLPKTHIASFLRGFYDAEGFVNQKMVCITVSNEKLIKTIQFLLIRLGIISSYIEMRRGFSKKTKHCLRVTDWNSIKNFHNKISFNSPEKQERLERIIYSNLNHPSKSDQIPISGKLVFKLAKELRMNLSDFPRVKTFFYDTRVQSYDVFKKEVFEYFKKRLSEIENLKKDNIRPLRQILRIKQNEIAKWFGISTTTVCDLEREKVRNVILENKIKEWLIKKKADLLKKGKETLYYLEKIQNSDLIQVKIYKIDKIKEKQTVYDLYIPKYGNFVANTLLIHNSQMRYLRIREEAKKEHMKKVAEIANSIFLPEKDLKGIIIGGPGPFKEKFNEGEYLDYQLRQKKLGVVDTSYDGIQGLQEMVQRAESLIQEASAVKERKLMEEFYSHLQKDDGLSVYGLDETKKVIEMGAVETLLISENYDWVRVKLKCHCGQELEKDTKPGMDHKCPNCGVSMNVLEENDLIEILSEEVKKFGTNVEIISVDSTEGEQFKNLGGIGGILRFKVE